MAIMNLMINRHEFRIYKEQYYKVAKILNKYLNCYFSSIIISAASKISCDAFI